ncbi:hypothetical protein BJV77DRAFT_116464 [Russula vinacea]|nr:hypothetical protein BJV77DRAFT_116464 [Russula vinacea]
MFSLFFPPSCIQLYSTLRMAAWCAFGGVDVTGRRRLRVRVREGQVCRTMQSLTARCSAGSGKCVIPAVTKEALGPAVGNVQPLPVLHFAYGSTGGFTGYDGTCKEGASQPMGFPGSQRQSVDAWGVGCSVRVMTNQEEKNAVTASAMHATCLVSPSPLVEFLQRFYLALSDSVSLYLFIYFGGLLPFRIVTLMSNRIGVSPARTGGALS